MHNLFKTKSMSSLMKEVSDSGQGLKRVLGPVHLTALGVGCVIGAGIFVLTGQAAAQYAGPSIVFSFIFSAIACAFAGLCYAEFASTIPVAGSAYTYAYVTLGEFSAWIIGWSLILEYLFGASTVAVGWSGYMVSFLKDWGLTIPPQLMGPTGTQLIQLPDTGAWIQISRDLLAELTLKGIDPAFLPHATAIFNLPAVLIIGAITTILVIGIKQSAIFNNIIVTIKIGVILLFILFCSSYIKPENWVPFIPPNTGEFGHFGFSGILRGAGVIFFAYVGFDALSTLAQEAKNPQRDMPISLMASLVICTIVYIAIALVMTGVVKYNNLLVPDPIALAVDTAGPALFWLRPIIKLGAVAGLSSVILVLLLGQTRIFYTMSKDGLLPPFFAKLHPQHQTPYITTIITGIVSAFFAAILPVSVLGELVSIGTLLAFVIVCIGILVLRYKRPDIKSVFKTPWVPFIPIMGALISLAQMLSLPLFTWLRLILWIFIGLIVYFLYGKKYSKVQNS